MEYAVDQLQRRRLLMVGTLATVFAVLIVQRLHWYQITDHETFAALANDSHEQRRAIPAKRGTLLDTRGNPLVVSVMYDSVYVYRPEVGTQEQRVIAVLASALGLGTDEVARRLQSADQHWVRIAARVPAHVSSRIEAERLPGVELRRIPEREYPEGSTASQVLGFIGTDGRGLSGLELTLDKDLAGRDGVVLTERDTIGSEITIGRKAAVAAVPGSDVVLTIDRYIQRVAERELAAAVQANKATGGNIIVMEPSTGAILAMASLPSFSLTSESLFDAIQPETSKPAAVTDAYEPGSVMKLVTVAGAIEDRLVTPDTPYRDVGVALVDGVPIRNWDGGAYGNVNVREILVRSLNTGTQWVASLLGPEKFYDYVESFGFGTPTGVRLNGEASGWFRRPTTRGWTRVDLATNSYGQSIAVTPLQMITAIAALGNGGVLMRPQLVREVRGPDETHTFAPEPIRQVVSQRTADTMLDMMVSVWNQPGLQPLRINGYTLAAKSGTADIPGPDGYRSGQTYASFAGFGPIPNPRFVILVRLDRPEAIYGGVVAAPVFRTVAQELLMYMHVPPNTR